MKSKLEFEANLTIDDWIFRELQYYVCIPILGKIKDENNVKIILEDNIIKIHHKNETCEQCFFYGYGLDQLSVSQKAEPIVLSKP
jgi:hypothetical protein